MTRRRGGRALAPIRPRGPGDMLSDVEIPGIGACQREAGRAAPTRESGFHHRQEPLWRQAAGKNLTRATLLSALETHGASFATPGRFTGWA